MTEQELKAIFKELNDLPLPDREKILAAAKEASPAPAGATVPRPVRRRPMRVLLAACLSILLIASVSAVCAAAVEHYEYRSAVAFFAQHELSTEGCTRREIKLVWRDITSGSFSCEKTQDVLTAGVGGYEITGDPLSPAELEQLWQSMAVFEEAQNENALAGFAVSGKVTPEGLSFRYKNQIRYVETVEDAYAVLEQYRDGRLVWEKTLTGVSIARLAFTERYLAIAAIVPGGNALLLCTPDGEETLRIPYDLPSRALLADDDSVTLVCADRSSIAIRTYDLQGSCLHAAKQSFADMGLSARNNDVGSVLRLDDQYVLQLTDDNGSDYLVKIDENAALLDEFRYTTPGEIYRFTDVASRGSDLYISGYTIPAGSTPYDELDAIKRQIIAAEGRISPDALAEQLKAGYTAILLKCSTATGQAEAFYVRPGALGDSFALDAAGNLVWQVHEIESAKGTCIKAWAGEPDAYIDAVCAVTAFTFDRDGILIGQQRTGEGVALGK